MINIENFQKNQKRPLNATVGNQKIGSVGLPEPNIFFCVA